MTEKRRFSRISFGVEAVISAGNRTCHTDTITNLSVGGCLLPVNEIFEPGEACVVTIPIPGTMDDLCVRVEGKVIRFENNEVAVHFISIDPDSLLHLKNIIRYNASDIDQVETELSKHPGLK